jgi:hypothetical protein
MGSAHFSEDAACYERGNVDMNTWYPGHWHMGNWLPMFQHMGFNPQQPAAVQEEKLAYSCSQCHHAGHRKGNPACPRPEPGPPCGCHNMVHGGCGRQEKHSFNKRAKSDDCPDSCAIGGSKACGAASFPTGHVVLMT